jgi:hypothetical protein
MSSTPASLDTSGRRWVLQLSVTVDSVRPQALDPLDFPYCHVEVRHGTIPIPMIRPHERARISALASFQICRTSSRSWGRYGGHCLTAEPSRARI